MTGAVLLCPGQTSLADWRAIYGGAPVALDPVSRADVEAGSAALDAIVSNRRDGLPPNGDGGPAVVELLHKEGGNLPLPITRVFVALKLASLAQGMSGVRWSLIERLADCLAKDLLPAIPRAAVTDRLALSHLFGTLTGTGEVLGGKTRPAAKALRKAGLGALTLNDDERAALLSGSQLSTALALVGLFEAERVLQSALVAAALTNDAVAGPHPLAPPRIYRLRRHPGQIEVASALRALLGEAGPERENGGKDGSNAPPFPRFLPDLGACLDLLRQAGVTLEHAANAVSEDRLVLWQTGELICAAEDAAPVAFAIDLIAMALREVGNVAERRIAALSNAGPGESEGVDAGGNAQLTRAASFNAENGERLRVETGADRPAGAAETAGRAGQLLAIAGTTSLVIAIEFLTAIRSGEPRASDGASTALGKVRDLLSARIGQNGAQSGFPAGDLAAAAELVRSGALAGAAGVELPSVIPPHPVSLPLARRAH